MGHADHEGQVCLRKDPCDSCGSSDGKGIYEDHTFCFVCREYQKTGEHAQAVTKRKQGAANLIVGEAFTETVREITPETFQFWRYTKGVNRDGKPVHLANHFVDGACIGQKVRGKNKEFNVIGKLDALYGRWLWADTGRMVVVTEGEIDALSVSQAQGNKWPVVSVPNGAAGAAASFRKAIEWLEGFEKVVIMFDQDEPGQAAAIECAALLSPGKAFIATLPVKDANEMLKEGFVKELVQAIWNAKAFRPDGIVSVADVRDKAMQPIEYGKPWFLPTLTEATYGRREGEVYFLGAGTGIGKTDMLLEQVAFDVAELHSSVGLIFLEMDTVELAKRLAGKVASKRFHIPDGKWTTQELVDALDKIDGTGKVFMYDNFGSTEWKTVKDRIRYMAVALGCKFIYLDHLTALASHAEDERKALEEITAELSMIAKQLRVTLVVVSHLATPEKGSHEEGARVTIRSFKGSRAIGFWAHFMFGLERDQQDDNPLMRNITTLRILKDRYTGLSTGKTVYLTYDHETGRVAEIDAAKVALMRESTPDSPMEDPSGDHGF